MPLQLPQMDPCYFCALILDADERWRIVEEKALTLTLLNGRQFEVGQALVITRRHAPTLLDMTDEEGTAVMAAAARLARAFVAAFDPDGVLLYQNNGVGSLQEVPHVHFHVVPRRQGSDWGPGPPHLARLQRADAPFDFAATTDEKRAAAAALRRALGSG